MLASQVHRPTAGVTDGRRLQMLTTFEALGRDGLVVSVFGELGEGDAPALQQRLFTYVDMGFRRTFLDMSRCRLLDWTGLDVLIANARHADGREVAVLSPTRHLRRLLEATGLSVALPVYASREEALGSAAAA
jgi:anti-anti-sigma factor